MDTNNTIYANAFRITMGQIETQIAFKLDTPIINEETNSIDSVKKDTVADVRLNPVLAKELHSKLGEQIAIYEQTYGQIITLP